jgi:hypothetical protein
VALLLASAGSAAAAALAARPAAPPIAQRRQRGHPRPAAMHCACMGAWAAPEAAASQIRHQPAAAEFPHAVPKSGGAQSRLGPVP